MERLTSIRYAGEKFIAQGFGSGLSPKAPGTVGTLVGAILYLPLRELGPMLFPLFVLVAFGVGVYLCEQVARRQGTHDDPSLVWDEMVGFWAVMIAAPDGWYWIVFAFVLFRLFDILKPWPISWLDRHVPGGLGIMVDDIAAALVSWLALQLCHQAIVYGGVTG